jgi:aerobic-type carbon monoxide dehydrogenase small subunit (CoxS/CutS family)
MVVINQKTVLSCQQKMEDLQGATVTTIEGLGTPTRYVPFGGAS